MFSGAATCAPEFQFTGDELANGTFSVAGVFPARNERLKCTTSNEVIRVECGFVRKLRC